MALVRRVDGVVEVRRTLRAPFDDRGVSPAPLGEFGVLSSRKPHH